MSQQTENGWFSAELDKARVEKTAKSALKGAPTNGAPKNNGTKPQPPKPAAPPPRMSLADKIRQATKGISSATGLKTMLGDARSVEESQEAVNGFVDLMEEINALAVFKIGDRKEISDEDAQDAWDTMSWDEKEAQLAGWAEEGDESARILSSRLKACYEDADGLENAPAKSFLRMIVDEFVDPLRRISDPDDMRLFMDRLAEEPALVTVIMNPSYGRDKGVVVRDNVGQEFLYLPKPGIRKTARAWPFIEYASKCIAEAQRATKPLANKATRKYTPFDISRGVEGTLFVPLSPTSAVLLAASRQSGHVIVEVTDSVGVTQDSLPQDSQIWSAERNNLATRDSKWRPICLGVSQLKRRIAEADKAKKEAFARKVAPLTSIATFGTDLKDRGLAKILAGEIGIAAFWHRGFKFHEEKKPRFFGVAIEHCADGYILRQVIADHSFDRRLIGDFLPLEINPDGTTSGRLQLISRADWSRFQSLKAVEALMRYRLNGENGSEFDDGWEQSSA